MTYPTFDALTQRLVELFRDKEFAAALELITSEGPRFPQDRMWADYWRMCAAARIGQTALTYQVGEQLLADGLWYGETLWRQTPSFIPLQGQPEFERLAAAHAAAQQAATPPGESPLLAYPPASPIASPPLLFALHGNMTSAEQTLPFWQAAVGQGWALGIPQSNQAMYTGAFVWDNLETTFGHVRAQLVRLAGQLAFDSRRVVLAGHSMGGLVAVQMALVGALDVIGFVVNGPATPFQDDPAALQAALPGALERRLRGYFIVGEQDTAIESAEIYALAETLQKAGLACAYETVPGSTHDYNPAYDAALLRGLAFIQQP